LVYEGNELSLLCVIPRRPHLFRKRFQQRPQTRQRASNDAVVEFNLRPSRCVGAEECWVQEGDLGFESV
jgi:hypothetical protein